MSASAGGLTMPSDTPSVTTTTNIAPEACANSASDGYDSITPKKFGDCTTTAATSSFNAACSALASAVPLAVKGISSTRKPEFSALDNRIRHHRAQVIVDACAEKTRVAV